MRPEHQPLGAESPAAMPARVVTYAVEEAAVKVSKQGGTQLTLSECTLVDQPNQGEQVCG
jgi:hypothetical protein